MPPPIRHLPPAPTLLLGAAVLAGIALRIWQYAANASLWLDELAVANNLLGRGALQLVAEPLEFGHIVPFGVLLLLKGLTVLFGEAEPVLRLYAFAMGTGALVLMALLARDLLDDAMAWVPVALIAVSGPLIMQSAQVKPYAGDLCLTLALLLLASRALRRGAVPRTGTAIALGAVAPWFSFPVLFTMGTAALILLWVARPGTERRRTLAVLGVWAASGAAALLLTWQVTTEPARLFMQSYWADGFPPRSLDAARWALATLVELLRELGDFRGTRPLALVAALSMVHLLARERRTAAILLLPLAAATVAAALRLYPFEGRVAHWALPIAALLTVHGCQWLLALTTRVDRRLPAVVLSALLLYPVLGLIRQPPPFRPQHARPVLTHLARTAQPGDAVYVHYGGWQAWRYYAPRTGADRVPAMTGSCSRADRGHLLRELRDVAPGEAVWLFFSHADPRLREREMLTRFLADAGARLTEEVNHPEPFINATLTSSVLRYDLGGVRWQGAAGDSLITAILAEIPGPAPGCWIPFMPDSLDRTPRN